LVIFGFMNGSVNCLARGRVFVGCLEVGLAFWFFMFFAFLKALGVISEPVA